MKQNRNIKHWSLEEIVQWLFQQGRLLNDLTQFVQQLSDQLVSAGAPVDRITTSFRTIDPLMLATSAIWNRDSNKTVPFKAQHGIENTDRYIGSPMQKLYDSREQVRQCLQQLPDDSHRAFVELAEAAYTDYFALPVEFSNKQGAALIIVTRCSQGFSDHDITNFTLLRDYISPVLEVYALKQLSRSVMDTYVGKRTSEKVLTGMIKRGDSDIIHAALWFSDLRNFTYLTETLPASQLLKMLNDYFENVAAAVTARGGEILRFIGDAMLIVFPITTNMDQKSACQAALEAAQDAQNAMASLNHLRRRHATPEIRFGVGLNIGEVIYGNVGAPDRLDFTVMGPVVNRTARIESLTKTIDEDVLLSEAFAQLLDTQTVFKGEHQLKGIAEPLRAFAPAQ